MKKLLSLLLGLVMLSGIVSAQTTSLEEKDITEFSFAAVFNVHDGDSTAIIDSISICGQYPGSVTITPSLLELSISGSVSKYDYDAKIAQGVFRLKESGTDDKYVVVYLLLDEQGNKLFYLQTPVKIYRLSNTPRSCVDLDSPK